MLELPSLGKLLVSSIVFFVAVWYLHRYCDEQGLPKGLTRTVSVMLLASIVSWASGHAVDLVQTRFSRTAPVSPQIAPTPR